MWSGIVTQLLTLALALLGALLGVIFGTWFIPGHRPNPGRGNGSSCLA
jgi:hypothetical protein